MNILNIFLVELSEFSYVWRLGSPNANELEAKKNVGKIGFILFFTPRNIDFLSEFFKYFFGGT